MDDIKLKPCPFCGKSVAVVCTVAEVDGDEENEWSNTHYVAVCDFDKGGCGSCGTCNNDSPEKAAEAWNRRDTNAVAVIRCGECYHMRPNGVCSEFADDTVRPSTADFCSYGRRKEEQT